MSTWQLICEPFIEKKLDDLEEFECSDVVNLFEAETQTTIDLYYTKILDEIIRSNSDLANHCRSKKKEFTVSL
jgi:hypothetical protein